MVQTGRARFKVIFGPPYRGRTLMLCLFHVFQAVGYYGFGTLVPTVLAAKGYSVVTSLTFTALTFIGYPVGSALSLPIVERVDRRWLIVASAALMSAFGLALGFASEAGHHPRRQGFSTRPRATCSRTRCTSFRWRSFQPSRERPQRGWPMA